MKRARIMAVGLSGAALAAALAVAPALGAMEKGLHAGKKAQNVALAAPIGGFTPVAADPRLAAIFARSGLDSGSFRFTPAEVRRSARAVTVAVRTRTNRADAPRAAGAGDGAAGLTPIAYNLGVAVGWKRFAVAGDVSRVDMASRPGSREAADVSVSYSASRFTGAVKAAADRPFADAPALVEEAPSYSVDLTSSYALTRNLNVTAGVRYRSDRERLTRLDDGRRDSQAVYVGTAFRF